MSSLISREKLQFPHHGVITVYLENHHSIISDKILKRDRVIAAVAKEFSNTQRTSPGIILGSLVVVGQLEDCKGLDHKTGSKILLTLSRVLRECAEKETYGLRATSML